MEFGDYSYKQGIQIQKYILHMDIFNNYHRRDHHKNLLGMNNRMDFYYYLYIINIQCYSSKLNIYVSIFHKNFEFNNNQRCIFQNNIHLQLKCNYWHMLHNFDYQNLYIFYIQMNKENNYFYLDIAIHYKIKHINNFQCLYNTQLDTHTNINF